MRKFLLLALLVMSAALARAEVSGAAFFAVVRSGDTDRAEEILRADKTLVFIEEPDGTTAFLAAVKNKDVKMARLLADSFSRLDVRTNGGNALHLAVSNNDEEMLRMLFAFMDEVEPELFESLANEPRGNPYFTRQRPQHASSFGRAKLQPAYLPFFGRARRKRNNPQPPPPNAQTAILFLQKNIRQKGSGSDARSRAGKTCRARGLFCSCGYSAKFLLIPFRIV